MAIPRSAGLLAFASSTIAGETAAIYLIATIESIVNID
jgi:hypothetical protein